MSTLLVKRVFAPLQISVSTMQVGGWAAVPAASVLDDELICENEFISSEGMPRKRTRRMCMAFGGSQRHKTQAALP